jgi:hypothetical protein
MACVVLGSFGPWLRSGRRLRSSYELLAVADRLGFLGDGPGRWLPRTWAFMPLAAALVLAALVWGRPRLGGTVGFAAGVYAVVLSVGTIASPLAVEWGTMVGAVGGTASVVGGLALVWFEQVAKKETAS